MSGKNYYYLVAGLPDLILEQSKVPASLGEFRQELREHLTPAHNRLVDLFFLPTDNQNVFNLLLNPEAGFDKSGQFPLEYLEEQLVSPSGLPVYLSRFIEAVRNNTPAIPGLSWEDQLWALYYDFALSAGNSFVASWFSFERNIRNLLAGLIARHYKLDVKEFLIGNDPITAAIQKSNARDFGLAAELPYVEKVVQIFDIQGLTHREKALDNLRWNYIDELNTFNYFSIEVIIGYVLKLQMASRWLSLDAATGADLFRRILNDLENSYEFPKEFKK